jgi:XTP/dITP diphosphohydrolase
VLPALVVSVSSRLPGLLSPAGWRALSGGRPLAALPGAAATANALRADGWDVADVPDVQHLTADVVVLATPDEVPPGTEVVDGAAEPPGARLLDVVAVMDRLRSPGGCPWDAEQTHATLATYLVEETYETLEAIDTGDRDHLREELGDLLLQVVFHARIAGEDPDDAWSVDDVAGGIVDKLVRRHPHVFGSTTAETAADVEAGWERQKAAEKGRASAVDGVPMALPALSLATKLVHRAEKNGIHVEPADGDTVGDRLMLLAVEARAAGLDPESELRAAARRFADRVRAAESDRSDR